MQKTYILLSVRGSFFDKQSYEGSLVPSLLQGLLLGAVTGGLALAIVVSLWLTTSTTTSTTTTAGKYMFLSGENRMISTHIILPLERIFVGGSAILALTPKENSVLLSATSTVFSSTIHSFSLKNYP